MVVPLDDREAELEGVVEERRRRLADAAADRREEQRADDHLALAEAALRRPRADRVVEREGLAGADDRPVDVVRHQLHVVDPVRRGRAHVRRERGDLLPDAELLGLAVVRSARICFNRREARLIEELAAAAIESATHLPSTRKAGPRGADPHALAVDDELRVDRPLAPVREQRLDGLRHPLRVEPDAEALDADPEADEPRELLPARASRRPRP